MINSGYPMNESAFNNRVKLDSITAGTYFREYDSNEIYQLMNLKHDQNSYVAKVRCEDNSTTEIRWDEYDDFIIVDKPDSGLMNGKNKNQQYVIYAEGTWKNYRALFKKHDGSALYSAEADAEQFTFDELKKYAKPTKQYRWVPRELGKK